MKGVPAKTQEDTKYMYCIRLWEEWCKYQLQTCGDHIPSISKPSSCELQHWLTRFVLEVRKKDGSEFPPNSLHHLCSGIVRYLHGNGHPSIDVFKDAEFAQF